MTRLGGSSFPLNTEGLEIPRKRELLDDVVAEYLEHLCPCHTVASLQDFDPNVSLVSAIA